MLVLHINLKVSYHLNTFSRSYVETCRPKYHKPYVQVNLGHMNLKGFPRVKRWCLEPKPAQSASTEFALCWPRDSQSHVKAFCWPSLLSWRYNKEDILLFQTGPTNPLIYNQCFPSKVPISGLWKGLYLDIGPDRDQVPKSGLWKGSTVQHKLLSLSDLCGFLEINETLCFLNCS